jgi:hypothetical protein
MSWVASLRTPSHMQMPVKVQTAKSSGRQTVKETIASYVGLDIHKDSIAVATADAGRAARRLIPADRARRLRGTYPPKEVISIM